MTRAREFADLAGSADAGGITGKNLIGNGAMQVAQRGTSFSDTGSASEGFFTLDRYHFQKSGLDEMRFTASQDSEVPSGQGFANSLKVAVTTAETELGANEYFRFRTRVEAQDLQHLAYNTSSAKPLTLSCWVRSSLTGKYSVLFFKADDGSPYRSNTTSFTISSANTWEKKTMTIAGDTGGVIDDDNGYGLSINFQLGAGTSYSGTPHTEWGVYSVTDDWSHSDSVNFIGQTGTFYITGIQLEVGDKATPFEHRSFADELARCQRYYYRKNADSAYSMLGSGMNATTSSSRIHIDFPVEMRTAPSLGQSANSTWAVYSGTQSPAFSSDATINNASTHSSAITTTTSASLTVGQGALLMANNDASAYLEFDAEF
tara:strand:+ start:133 stop:1254 length:1122 start_codon:yes stop_codon:yes gene_type:complete